MIKYIPNILSVFRLVVAVFFPFSDGKYWLLLIVSGGLSDFLDGWVARKWNVSSWLGRVLDAVADKLFVLSVLCTFVYAGNISLWFVPFIIARDLVVVVIALYTHYCQAWHRFKDVKSRWSGKIATTGQFFLLVTIASLPAFIKTALIISIPLSIAAAIDYALQCIKAARQSPGKVSQDSKNIVY